MKAVSKNIIRFVLLLIGGYIVAAVMYKIVKRTSDKRSKSFGSVKHFSKKKSAPIRFTVLGDPMTHSFTISVRKAIKRKKQLGLPVARYDEKADRAFLEYSDGRREYVQIP